MTKLPLAFLIPPSLIINSDENLTLIAFVTTCVLLLITTIYIISKARGPKRDTILICGLSESGKTVLYHQVRYDKTVETHTSMNENSARFIPPESILKSPVTVHDLPGHPTLRHLYTQYIPSTSLVIFLLDSTTITRPPVLRAVSEYLYDLLANRYTATNQVKILVLCNKADMLMSLDEERCKGLIEGEIDKLRQTRTSTLHHADAEHEDEFLGEEDEPFKIEHLPNEVVFRRCSLIKDDKDTGVENGAMVAREFINRVVR